MPNAAFWDRIAPKYAKQPISNPDAYAETLRRVRAALQPSDVVMEIGAGTGSTAMTLAPEVARYIATDVSPGMMDIAAGKLDEVPIPGLEFRVGTATDIPFQSELDAVLAFNLLHLVEDIDGALAKIHASLKPGGLFISKTGCIGGAIHMRVIIGAMQLVGKAPWVGYYTRKALLQKYEAAGFEVLEDEFLAKPALFVIARKA